MAASTMGMNRLSGARFDPPSARDGLADTALSSEGEHA
jgi:hypothetical protein